MCSYASICNGTCVCSCCLVLWPSDRGVNVYMCQVTPTQYNVRFPFGNPVHCCSVFGPPHHSMRRSWSGPTLTAAMSCLCSQSRRVASSKALHDSSQGRVETSPRRPGCFPLVSHRAAWPCSSLSGCTGNSLGWCVMEGGAVLSHPPLPSPPLPSPPHSVVTCRSSTR